MPRFSRSLHLTLFLTALLLRLAFTATRGELTPPPIPGAEAGVIAQHLLQHHAFLTPFDPSPNASPSTHLPPLYPAFLALSQYAGLSSTGTFYLALALNLLASASLPLIMLHLGTALNLPRNTTLLAALLMLLCPESLRATGLIWDEALFVSLIALLSSLILSKLPTFSPKHALLLGLANGALALLNPAMVIALPAATLAALLAKKLPLKPLAISTLLLVAGTLLASSPWHLRNWFLLNPPAPVFIRGNFWLEVWSNLHPLSPAPDGKLLPLHPWQHTDPLAKDGQPLTEAQYFAWCKQRALAAFQNNPTLLPSHLATQANAFWLGIAEARRWHKNPLPFFLAQGLPALAGILGLLLARRSLPAPAFTFLLTLLLVFPLPYYLTGGAARYRHPLDFILYLGAAYLLSRPRSILLTQGENPGHSR